eukprot:1178813-Prorocentrum_minimum.AAC.4
MALSPFTFAYKRYHPRQCVTLRSLGVIATLAPYKPPQSLCLPPRPPTHPHRASACHPDLPRTPTKPLLAFPTLQTPPQSLCLPPQHPTHSHRASACLPNPPHTHTGPLLVTLAPYAPQA